MNPTVYAKSPVKVSVENGKDYWWCTCGLSEDQPFCNGSHKGTGFSPKKYTADKDGDVWFCQCKHSASGALCDGSHKTLP